MDCHLRFSFKSIALIHPTVKETTTFPCKKQMQAHSLLKESLLNFCLDINMKILFAFSTFFCLQCEFFQGHHHVFPNLEQTIVFWKSGFLHNSGNAKINLQLIL